MKISTKLIKGMNERYGSAGDPAREGSDELLKKIGAQLAAIEETEDFGKRYEGAVVVKVVSCEDHPNADRLHVCLVDDGRVVQDVARNEDGYVQVVCGAPNVRADMLAVWLPPGATVPSTFGKEPFVLTSREFRGVTSNGMMASPKELGLGDSHEGLLIIDETIGKITPGTYFVDAYSLKDDLVIDMENKMFTHRPDLFGWIGIARELEGIQRRPYKSPEWYTQNPDFPAPEDDLLPMEVNNKIPDVVPRFTAVVIRDVQIKPSPVHMQVHLARVGLRPINNIVDHTNFFMYETGQPLHAYDYDKVKALSGGDKAVLTVRYGKKGEKLALLNGKEVEITEDDMIVVAGDNHLAGIGGAMGGLDTEVDEHTKNIIIEAATWDMYTIRRTSMRHGIFTDAVTRFNKGQSPLQNKLVVAKITDEIRKFAGGKVASALIDLNYVPQEARDRGNIHPPVSVTPKFINERLGWQLTADEMATLLRNVEFTVVLSSRHSREGGNPEDLLTVTAPFWRTDIEIPEDVVEEIGRLYGYDHLPLALPKRDLTPPHKDPMIVMESVLRNSLAAGGANEVLTYNFVHGDLLDKVGQPRDRAFRLSNALSPDLQYMRLSVTPSLLQLVHPNVKAGHDNFALYELGKVHIKGLETEGLPTEFERLAVVVAADVKGAKAYEGTAYYQAKAYLMHALHAVGLDTSVRFEPLDVEEGDVAVTYYQAGRAAKVKIGDVTIGRIGEYKASVRHSLKLPDFVAGFELGLAPVLLCAEGTGTYVSLPRFPKVEQDVCLRVSADIPYVTVYNFVDSHVQQKRPDQTRHVLSPVDVYQRAEDPGHKQITLRLSLASYERTLTAQEVATLLDGIATAAKNELHAERV